MPSSMIRMIVDVPVVLTKDDTTEPASAHTLNTENRLYMLAETAPRKGTLHFRTQTPY
jgi:hypothetical protein